eukprot:TRINITY_DN4119_c0_g1_i1.p1 TRINITY_DN4119_c0_g1~~TRINITY_DN4119_c0_g1_i1.p1  ORF type:complete len:234 (-),score=28.16 TRINITY_DN4119_c0_g1_i1:231-932(-)
MALFRGALVALGLASQAELAAAQVVAPVTPAVTAPPAVPEPFAAVTTVAPLGPTLPPIEAFTTSGFYNPFGGAPPTACPLNVTLGSIPIGGVCNKECGEQCMNVTNMANASKTLKRLVCDNPSNPEPGQEEQCQTLLVPFGCCIETPTGNRCGTAEECNEQVSAVIDQAEEILSKILHAGAGVLVLLFCCGCCCCAVCLYVCYAAFCKPEKRQSGGHSDSGDEYAVDGVLMNE